MSQFSTQGALAPSIVLGQCFGLLPVVDVFRTVKFKWWSVRLVFSALCGFVQFVHCGFIVAMVCSLDHAELGDYVSIFFYLFEFLTWCSFLNMARTWPSVMASWGEVDSSMNKKYGVPKRLKLKLNVLSFAIMLAAIIEHTMFMIHDVGDMPEDGHSVNGYWKMRYRQFFMFLPYSFSLGLLAQIVVILVTFTWNYMDLFIMLISLALVARFVQFKERVQKGVEEARSREKTKMAAVISSAVWREMREDYCRLDALARQLDDSVGCIVLLSFISNMFIILIQLLHSLE